MSRLDPDFPFERVALDMDHVARAATAPDLRTWWLEYDCHGTPYNWRGQALNESAADSLGRHDLAVKAAGFNAAEATLTVCLEC